MFKIGDVVYTPEYPDTEYFKKCGINRHHTNFFGRVTDVTTYPDGETVIDVDFGNRYEEWAYSENELRPASDLKNMALEEISSKFGLVINGTYLMYANKDNCK